MTVPFLACMIAAAGWYNLPPRVLPSILAVEGGQLGSVSHNKNGSDDLGPMQVNSRWVPVLARIVRQPQTVVRQRLIDEPCFDIAAAGAILRAELDEAHGDLMVAVGWYHSHTPERSAWYRGRVVRAAERMFGSHCQRTGCR